MSSETSPDEKPSAASIDAIDMERLQKLVTLETASDATTRIVGWGKWALGAVVAVFFMVGITTYTEFRSRLDKAVSDAADSVATQAAERVEQETEKALDSVRGDIEDAKSKLMAELRDEFATATAELKEERAHAVRRIRAIGVVSSAADLNVAITIYDLEEARELPGKRVRSAGEPATGNDNIDRLYDYLIVCHKFFHTVFDRDSFDGQGGEIIATTNYGKNYNNTFWDGRQLAFGNGDGKIFKTFIELDIVASEYSVAIIENTAKLKYEEESGALHRHLADVFGSLVEQWHFGQTADQADWLIGDKILGPDIKGIALRSLKEPGSAYDDPLLGKDEQPKHISNYVETKTGFAAVHINSGIPNHAFYLVATKIGGNAWEDAGKIWYQTLLILQPETTFQQFADATAAKAGELFGQDSRQLKAVVEAWKAVGIDV